MPNYKLIVPVVAVATIGATIAIAEVIRDRHDHEGRNGGADSMAWRREMCADRFAHDVGKVAYVETRLELTDTQRPAFEGWKSAVLAGAKSQESNCATHVRDPNHPPTVLDREAGEELMLKMRLAALDAELPSLNSLYESLSPAQKAVFDRPMHEHEGHGHGGGDHWGAHGHESRSGDSSDEHDE